MTILGVGLLVWRYRAEGKGRTSLASERQVLTNKEPSWLQRAAFAALVTIPLVIPSDWTQDVPERYGGRHEGMEHSAFYPRVPAAEEFE
jgi:hypothetical protein